MSTLLHHLQEELRKGQVVVVVGAGVSVAATGGSPIASWSGLLLNGVDHCEAVAHPLPLGWGNPVRQQIQSGDTLEMVLAAENIATRLSAPAGGDYRSWLRETVGSLKPEQSAVLETLRDLEVLLATTNYDSLLESVTGVPAVTWLDAAKVQRVLRCDDVGILHLHGHWERPESVVLGIRSYEQVLCNEQAQTALRTLWMMKTLLFVGYGTGLQDPNFSALLRWARRVFPDSEYRHFRLAREADVRDLQDQHSAEERLAVLSYGRNFEDLVPFLRALAPCPPTGVRETADASARASETRLDPRSSAKDQYRRWVLDTNRSFYIPALDIQLPTMDAWNQVRWAGVIEASKAAASDALAHHIRDYHEWERLADPLERGPRFWIEDVLEAHLRVVVTGGPGAGKSTLLRRLAHWTAERGKIPLRVPLKLATNLFLDGKRFEDAVILAAADAAGLGEQVAVESLDDPDYLLADGLDECEPHRVLVAQKLVEWAAGHPDCRVCVTTRPIGHAPSLLPGFTSVELLPLDVLTIAESATKLVAAAAPGSGVADRFWELIREPSDGVTRSHAASVAARNPLLLSFLVRLHLDGLPLQGNRSMLFERMIDQIYRVPLADRALERQLSRASAQYALEAIGWMLVDQPACSDEELCRFVAADLVRATGQSPLQASELAEQAIRFWEARRLLERLRVGHIEALTFVHLALGEFCAGGYIKRMPDAQLREWLSGVRREAKWRQPLLLACGSGDAERIISGLLELDDPSDPCATEASIAAAGLAELAHPSPSLGEAVARALQTRLASPVPLVCVEAAEALVELAPLSPGIIGPLAVPFIHHDQPWTRLGAIAICLTAGSEYISLRETETWLEEFEPDPEEAADRTVSGPTEGIPNFHIIWATDAPWSRGLPEEAYELQQQALVRAADRLFDDLEADAAVERILRILIGGISMSSEHSLCEVLSRRGAEHTVEEFLTRRTSEQIAHQRAIERQGIEATSAFLEAVLAATGRGYERTEKPDGRPLSLARLFVALGFPGLSIGDWYVLGRRQEELALVEVIRGAIVALHIDPATLAAESSLALDWLRDSRLSLSLWLPDLPTPPEWPRRIEARLNHRLLLRSIRHPSMAVRVGAAYLVSGGVGGRDLAADLERGLCDGDEAMLKFVASVAPWVWGSERAANLLLERLRGRLCDGFEHVCVPVARLIGPHDRSEVLQLLLNHLLCDDPYIADACGKAIRQLAPATTPELVGRLRVAMEHWNGLLTRSGNSNAVQVSAIRRNRLGTPPDPRRVLISELVRIKGTDVEDLCHLCEDASATLHDVAVEELTKEAARSESTLLELIGRVHNGQVSDRLLCSILDLPIKALAPATDQLLRLTECRSLTVRKRIVRGLTGAWVDRQTALQRAQAVVDDPDSEVRDEAVRVLRVLNSVERQPPPDTFLS